MNAPPKMDPTFSAMQEDLSKSGLTPDDLKAQPIDAIHRLACNIPSSVGGYVIPYYDMQGKPLPFYRTRLFDHRNVANEEVKYKQIRNTPNHVYFPRGFLEALQRLKPEDRLILVTEGEKKAVAAQKHLGIPTIAFGGVDSWRNKVLLLPKGVEFTSHKQNPNLVAAKVDDLADIEMLMDGYAKGFEDVVNLGFRFGATFMIVYDTDTLKGTKPEVQRAAAVLGYELRNRGFSLPQVRQLVLPPLPELNKTSLDDFLMSAAGGKEKLHELIRKNRAKPSSFPRHPNPREFLARKLQSPRLNRKDMQQLSLALLTELDARGRRMYTPATDRFFYFDNASAELMPVLLNVQNIVRIQDTSFGRLLYREFGLAPAADSRLTQWLGAQYSAEEPIEAVAPHRFIARPRDGEDIFRIQINNSQYVKITGDPQKPFAILNNGTDNILFESKAVEEIDAALLKEELNLQYLNVMPLENWWDEVLSKVRLKDHGPHRKLISLLYYLSPFIYRWRGTQLPVELIMGESGSGKSTLCELRLGILLGDPTLRNAPGDLKDWHASVANTGGLHITDNVHFVDKTLRQKLSDEICRLITEPDPHVEMRKYYTEADLIRLPVTPIFGFTAIQQPFHNADLLQRAILLELDKSDPAAAVGGVVEYDSRWKADRLAERGGRTGWLAHHMVVLARFLQAVNKHWQRDYKAKHRLINLEQALIILARDVFKMDWEWIPGHLSKGVEKSVSEADWVLEGICSFVDYVFKTGQEKGRIAASSIVTWAKEEEDFKENPILTNARQLGKWLPANKHLAASVAGLVENGSYANKQVYTVKKTNRHITTGVL